MVSNEETKDGPTVAPYYVYLHIDPATETVLYVGMGKGSRAYATKTVKVKKAAYGHRSPEHSERLDELLNAGYLPHEWIKFEARGLSKRAALKLERKLVEELKPLFNRKFGIKQLRFNSDEVKHIVKLREEGLSYKQIGLKMGCSTMVAHRILNGKSPNYKDMINGV